MSILPAIVQQTALRVFSGIITVSPHRSIQRTIPGAGPKGEDIIQSIVADAVLQEIHEDELVITDHPVERGSAISDHAYKLPMEVNLVYSWSGASSQNGGNIPPILQGIPQIPKLNDGSNFLRKLYQDFLALQEDRDLVDIFTGKRQYQNMLIKSIRETTDKTTENVLVLTVVCREILIAQTKIVTISPDQKSQLFPNRTQVETNNGAVQPTPPSTITLPTALQDIGLADSGS